MIGGKQRCSNATIQSNNAETDDRGYIYTGDTQRGMDVLKFERPKGMTNVHPGVWLNPQQALFRGLKAKAAIATRQVPHRGR